MQKTNNRSQITGRLNRNGFEIWRHFFWANPLSNDSGPEPFLLEFLLLSPLRKDRKKQPYFHLQGSSFTMVRLVRLKNCLQPAVFVGMQEVELSKKILLLRFGRNMCMEDASMGQILTLDKDIGVRFGLSTAGSVSWNLRINKQYSYGDIFNLNSLMTACGIISMNWYLGGLKVNFDGTLVINEDEFKAYSSTSYGFQDKIWGSHLGQSWIKLYGGYLSSVHDEKKSLNDAITIFRYQRSIYGLSDNFVHHCVYVYDGVLYDFSSNVKKTVYTCKEIIQNNTIEVHIELTATTERLVVLLKLDNTSRCRVNYPHPTGNNFSVFINEVTYGEIELYRLVSLVGWQKLSHQQIHRAVYESSSSFI